MAPEMHTTRTRDQAEGFRQFCARKGYRIIREIMAGPDREHRLFLYRTR